MAVAAARAMASAAQQSRNLWRHNASASRRIGVRKSAWRKRPASVAKINLNMARSTICKQRHRQQAFNQL